MNKLVCLFFLACCLSLATCKKKVEEFVPYTKDVEHFQNYPYYYKSSTSNPLYQKSPEYKRDYEYPYYQENYERIPNFYEGQSRFVYPSSYEFSRYGRDLSSSDYEYPYYQYPSIGARWYMWKSKFFNPYLSLPYYQNFQSQIPSRMYATSYPINYLRNTPVNYQSVYPSVE